MTIRHYFVKETVLFNRDKAFSHLPAIATTKLLWITASSAIFTRSDYQWFTLISDFEKKKLGGKRFKTNEDVISEINAYFIFIAIPLIIIASNVAQILPELAWKAILISYNVSKWIVTPSHRNSTNISNHPRSCV